MTTIIGTGEVGALHSREELEEMQRLPLQRKIQITTARIIEWYQHYDGKVYVAFSGGKDSTVLLDIVRRIYPDVPAVFSDTGLEFPEVREFIKSCENVTIVRPEMNFRKVIEVYGYPVISKRVADTVEYGHKPGSFRWKELHGEIMRSNGTPSEFNCEKWCYLLDAPFKVSSRCCTVMKKRPMKKYSKETGRVPIIATMANESRSRRATWLRMGCNAFSGKKPSSQPMSFWTEEDVLEYLYTYQVPYASVYGEIVRTDRGGWTTTGEKRTGCVFCAFGAHLEKAPNRFQRLKITHPKLWDYCMRPWEEHGLGMRQVLICSRGGTFTHTAKALKEAGAEEVMLYVTHCENTILKGTVLTDGLISRVFATDSILRIDHEKISICR